jgi:hypothetical protein
MNLSASLKVVFEIPESRSYLQADLPVFLSTTTAWIIPIQINTSCTPRNTAPPNFWEYAFRKDSQHVSRLPGPNCDRYAQASRFLQDTVTIIIGVLV